MNQPVTFTLASDAIIVGQSSPLTLTLTNDSGAPLNLCGGTQVAEDDIDTHSPSTFYLNLGTLISTTNFADITITAPTGWTPQFWPGAQPHPLPSGSALLRTSRSRQEGRFRSP